GTGATSEASSVGRAERLAPVPDRLVRDGDAPLGREIFDVAAAEREPVVKPDREAHDRRWEPVPAIADDLDGHAGYCAGGLKLTIPRCTLMNEKATPFQTRFVTICGTATFVSALVAVVGGNIPFASGVGVALMPFEAVALFVGL